MFLLLLLLSPANLPDHAKGVNGVLGEQSPRIPSPSVGRRQKKLIEGTFKLKGDQFVSCRILF